MNKASNSEGSAATIASGVLLARRLKRYTWALALASFGLNATFFVPLQNLLPRMIEAHASAGGKGVALGLVSGAGALVALFANPIAGHLSDKRARIGGRRSWLFAGAASGAAAILLLAAQHSLWGIALLWPVAQFCLNMAYAPLVASVVDHIPLGEQGVVWGYVGVARAVGLIAGFALLAIPPGTTASGMIAVAGLYVLSVLPVALIINKVPLVPRAKSRKTAITKVAVLGAVRSHDFRALLWVRLLVTLASSVVLTYLLYYLQDVIHYPRPDQGQAILIGLSMITTIVASIGVGKLSDETGKRRRYLVQATMLIVGGGLLLAALPTWPTTLLAALIIGAAMGVFASAGQSLAVRALPDVLSAGRDLGIMNIGSVLPQVVGPLIGSGLLFAGVSYRGLFVVSALLAAAAFAVLQGIHDQA